jgi:hypothetical protein
MKIPAHLTLLKKIYSKIYSNILYSLFVIKIEINTVKVAVILMEAAQHVFPRHIVPNPKNCRIFGKISSRLRVKGKRNDISYCGSRDHDIITENFENCTVWPICSINWDRKWSLVHVPIVLVSAKLSHQKKKFDCKHIFGKYFLSSFGTNGDFSR